MQVTRVADLLPELDICIVGTFEVSLWRHRHFVAFVKIFRGSFLDLDSIPHGKVIRGQIVIGSQMSERVPGDNIRNTVLHIIHHRKALNKFQN